MIQVDHVRLMFAEIEQLRQNAWKELSSEEVDDQTTYRQLTHWRNPHMPIAITASRGQFVTGASQLPGQFVAPG